MTILAARAFVFALLLCLGSLHGWAQQNNQQQMRGLDEEVQQIKSDILGIAAHKLEVLVDGKLEGGADFSRTERFTFRKEDKPKLVGLTLAGSGNTPITLGEW
jgi:hypothetical protein